MRKTKISVIIPNWNGAFLLKKNLPKVIEAKNNTINRITEILVVDDFSTDESVAVLEKYFKDDVRIIKHQKNQRFAATVNTGVRFSTGTHICLLNTDVIPESNFLVSTLNFLKEKDVFGVTLHEKGFGPAVGYFDGYLKHSSGPEAQTPLETLWISGGSGVFSKEKWQELHGLDSELFSPFYWEDVDLGYRAHKRGYKLIWANDANVVHKHESVTSPKNFNRDYLSLIKERNELLFIWKNITSKNLIKKHRDALIQRLIHHPGYAKVVVVSLLKWQLVVSRRKREKAESSISDEAIFSRFSKYL